MRPLEGNIDVLIDDVAHRKRQLEELRHEAETGDLKQRKDRARAIAIYESEIVDLEAQISVLRAVPN